MSKKKSKDYNKASSVEDDIKELIEQGFLEKVNKFKHFNGVLDYEKIQSKYDDIC